MLINATEFNYVTEYEKLKRFSSIPKFRFKLAGNSCYAAGASSRHVLILTAGSRKKVGLYIFCLNS